MDKVRWREHSNCVPPEYLFMQKRAGSVGETEHGLPLRYSGDDLHASLHSQLSWGL